MEIKINYIEIYIIKIVMDQDLNSLQCLNNIDTISFIDKLVKMLSKYDMNELSNYIFTYRKGLNKIIIDNVLNKWLEDYSNLEIFFDYKTINELVKFMCKLDIKYMEKYLIDLDNSHSKRKERGIIKFGIDM